MPVWDFKLSPNVLSPVEKAHLAQIITQLYVSHGLPAFYVQVHFFEEVPGTTFIGGRPHPNFAAVTILHLARAFTGDEAKQRFLTAVDHILNPIFEPKGADWEYFVLEGSRDLWKMNGLVPPNPGSEEEKEWARANKPLKVAKLSPV